MGFLNSKQQFTGAAEIEYADDNILRVAGLSLFKSNEQGTGSSGICLDGVTLVNRALTLHGWAFGYDRIEVFRDGKIVQSVITRLSRPDVVAAHPEIVDGVPGFGIVVHNAAPGEYSLRCIGPAFPAPGQHFLLAIDFPSLCVAPHVASLPREFEDGNTIAAAVDKVFNLGDGGVLIFGWLIDTRSSIRSVTFHANGRGSIDVTERFFRVARADVMNAYKGRYPQVPELSGFVVRVDAQLSGDEAFGLCFECVDRGQICLGSKVDGDAEPSVQLIKDVLTFVPHPERIRHSLYDLFDRILGEPISLIANSMQTRPRKPQIKQFGTLPPLADVSVVIPLYGRYDFLRYQMARFHADADFARVDLIYVVDDPNILSATLELAASMYELYGLPFRVIWYDRNLGFAGANNVGAGMAIAPKLLLLNSDIIPQKPKWVSALARSLDEPGVGAVGPLLQFYDGSVQHAGMAPNASPHYPNFIFNAHPGKGGHWADAIDAYEVPLLTAACLMVRTEDYWEIGGLDEGYIVGDFEDSDLCLKLRHKGLHLILNPQPKLFHLERQSQNLEAISSSRHLLTLYNSWRYTKKILNGEVARPGGEF